MPKEPKKFINPLLRPSSTAEQKSEPEQVVEKPSRKSSVEKLASPPSQPGTQQEAPVSAPSARGREEQVLEQAPVAEASTKSISAPKQEVQPEVEVLPKEPVFSTVAAQSQAPTPTHTYVSPYTYTSQTEQQAPGQRLVEQVSETRQEQPVPQFPAPPPPTRLPAASYADVEQRPTYERQQRPVEPVLYNEMEQEHQTVPYNRNVSGPLGHTQDQREVSGPLGYTQDQRNVSGPLGYGQDQRSVSGPLGYTQTEIGNYPSSSQFLPSQSTAPLPAFSESFEHRTGELLETTEFSARGTLRRRRGAQTFERTHERITLWIDKRLKQAFDELAYESELPKTALLNEAIADLLRKYRG